MSVFIMFRAVFVRVLFTTHGLVAIWRLAMTSGNPIYWYISTALVGLGIETGVTLYKKRGHDWKWFCPSVMFYLLSVVPAIWFLELNELESRISMRKSLNLTGSAMTSQNTNQSGTGDIDLSKYLSNIGLQVRIPLSMTSDQWIRTLEQLLLLFLILGRWMLPKGKLSHDQLSHLLLVYIGTAGDIVELFEAFKEEQVRYDRVLCIVILSIWSWSLMQFTMVLTATKARKDRTGLLPNVREDVDLYGSPGHHRQHKFVCCTPDVYGVIISICMQDAPFLSLRLVLIFKYRVLSYTNMFFTCKNTLVSVLVSLVEDKNTLVCSLLVYRLIVVQFERRRQAMKRFRQWASLHSKRNSSDAAVTSVQRLVTMAKSASSIANSATAVLRKSQSTGAQSTATAVSSWRPAGADEEKPSTLTPSADELEPAVHYVIRRRFSDSNHPTDDDEGVTNNDYRDSQSVKTKKKKEVNNTAEPAEVERCLPVDETDDKHVINYVIKRHL